MSEKLIGLILKGADLSKIELEDGKVKDAEKVSEAIKEEYKDYIPTSSGSGTKTETPPPAGGEPETDLGKLSMEEYIKARNKK